MNAKATPMVKDHAIPDRDRIPRLETLKLEPAHIGELRSDHAGETGAVAIYQGLLAVTRDPELRHFATEHLRAERVHLAFFDALLPPAQRSRLLPLWRLSGWLLGALPALLGRRWVYGTIEAVETFVVEHYQQQLDQFPRDTSAQRALCAELLRFQQDEAEHREDAETRAEPDAEPGALLKIWQRVVDQGSRAAVVAARRI